MTAGRGFKRFAPARFFEPVGTVAAGFSDRQAARVQSRHKVRAMADSPRPAHRAGARRDLCESQPPGFRNRLAHHLDAHQRAFGQSSG